MTQTANFVWQQGEDLDIKLIYKEGPAGSEVAVDLSTGYALRMDIVVPSSDLRIYTFNSASIADVDPLTAGAQPDSVIEATLTSGAGGTPNITISVPHAITLPTTGEAYLQMTANPPVTVFNYDIFLRNTGTSKQTKILSGTITVQESATLWV